MKNYSDEMKVCLENAEKIATLSGNLLNSVHLLIAITKCECIGRTILQRLSFPAEKAETYLLKNAIHFEKEVIISPIVRDILDQAEKISSGIPITTYHLLMAICAQKESSASKILALYGVTFDVLSSLSEPREKKINVSEENNSVDGKSSSIFISTKKETVSDDLSTENGIDLTEIAKTGKYNNIYGREKEVKRLIQILSRKRKNSPILVGNPGVGKTATVFSLAHELVFGNVPENISNKKIISVTVGHWVAGTKYRGEMEEKILTIIKKIKDEGNILFIDDLHTAFPAGNSETGLSISEILKSELNDENFLMIGATTFSEYAKKIETDSAFTRRFMKVTIEEPDYETNVNIIKTLQNEYETHYHVKISDEAIAEAVKLSSRYITNKSQPDKTIDLLDECCSNMALFNPKNVIGIDEIKNTLSQITGIPIAEDDDETYKILHLKESLCSRIIGQEEAVDSIVNAIKRSRSGLREVKKPIGSFIFLGTTGVGKTETAKALAEAMFGNEKAMIRFDMSEYMEKNSVTKLIGAPPGYVGYEEGGVLTESVKNKPYSVILFDEIEKAHGDVYNILLQVLDDGRLTDAKGTTVDFRNTIIILTGNIGVDAASRTSTSVGFGDKDFFVDEKEIILNELKKTFKPEFINRIDKIVIFQRLNKENLRKITDNILERKKKLLLEEKGILLQFDQTVSAFIVEKSFDDKYGARPIKRTIETLLENELSEMILEKNLKNTEIFVSVSNNKILLSE